MNFFLSRSLLPRYTRKLMNDRLPPKGVCSGSRVLLKFWEISDNISETVQDMVAMEV